MRGGKLPYYEMFTRGWPVLLVRFGLLVFLTPVIGVLDMSEKVSIVRKKGLRISPALYHYIVSVLFKDM